MTDLNAFRNEIRTWLKENCPVEMRRPSRDQDDVCWGGRNYEFKNKAEKLWLERCAAKGYTVPDWPKPYGGAGMDLAEAKVWREELHRINARRPLAGMGITMLGPALLKFGTEEQKVHYLNQIARGEIRWCQGYSEPGSGSDLVSLQTFGEEVSDPVEGDHWVVNGQKIWTSHANEADWIFCLVRTDKTNKYQGISFLLFDMASEGVSTKPIRLISGNSTFCETFFNNVKVPSHQIVGEVGRGWDVAKHLLSHEREAISAFGGGERARSLGAEFTEQGVTMNTILRSEVALYDINALAFAAMSEKFIDEAKVGLAHPAQPNMMKYAGTELNKQRLELMMAAGGSEALVWGTVADEQGTIAPEWLRSKGNSIEGGTSEVMLNVVAKRILNLPCA